jgi:hypothetical protein
VAQQGEIERALQLWQQSLEIRERISDLHGKGVTLHAMAAVICGSFRLRMSRGGTPWSGARNCGGFRKSP